MMPWMMYSPTSSERIVLFILSGSLGGTVKDFIDTSTTKLVALSNVLWRSGETKIAPQAAGGAGALSTPGARSHQCPRASERARHTRPSGWPSPAEANACLEVLHGASILGFETVEVLIVKLSYRLLKQWTSTALEPTIVAIPARSLRAPVLVTLLTREGPERKPASHQ